MNIMFTADIHANKKRLPDVIKFLKFCETTIEKEDVDLFVIGGDLWNAMVPNTKGSGFVDVMNCLKDICNITGLAVMYGTPSHEPEGSLDFISNLNSSACGSVEVYRKATVQTFNNCCINDCEDVRILFIPEPRRSDFISDNAKETSKKINEYLDKACSKKADIIFYHGEIDGAVMDNGMTCKSDYRLSKSMIEKSGAKIVLAGHIHTPQSPMKNVYYAGSPIPCNFGETHSGSVILFKYNNGISNLRRIPVNSPVYRTFELESMSELEGIKKLNLSNTHIKITIPVSASEKLSFNIPEESKDIKEKTKAIDVKIQIFTDKSPSVRSKEIVKATAITDKLKIYSDINELHITDSVLEKAKTMEDNLFINYTFPSHSFELISLDLRGAKGIKGREDIFIDFSKFEDGLVALVGNNGCGKTTLLEMASPFPCLLTRSGALKNHFYLKDSHKIVVFKDETGTYYKFTIQLAAHIENGLVKYFAETSEDGVTWKPVKECTGNLTDYQNYVESLFGNVSLYLRTAFFTKGNTKGTPDIASATKGERITLLSQLLGTDSLTALHTMANDKLKEIKSELDKISNFENDYNVLDTELKERETKKRIISKDLKNTDSQLDQLHKDIPELQKKADDFNEKYAGKSNPVDLKAECEKRVNDLTYHLDSLRAHKQRNDFYKTNEDKIKEYTECYNKNEELQNKIRTESSKLTKLSEQYYESKSEYAAAVSKTEVESNKITNTKAKVKSLEESLPEMSDYCPTCGAKLSERKKKLLFEEQEKINDEINSIKEFITNQEQVVKDCKKSESSLKTKMNNCEKKLNDQKELYDDLDGQSVSTSVYLDINSELKEYINYIVVSNLETDIEKTMKNLSQEKNMLTSLSTEEFVDYNTELNKKKTEESRLSQLQIKLSMDLASIDTEIKLKSEEISKIKEEKERADFLNKEYDDYSFLEKAFSNSGIQALELESAAPSIAELTNQILKESYGDKFTVSFSTLKQGRNKLIDDFSINVTNNESGWTTPIELLSEGEKIWVIQSLYYAFSLIRMEKTGFSFKVRFVDESDGALDSDMRLKYVQMIESAHKAGNARLTVMITHSQEVKDIVSQVINL